MAEEVFEPKTFARFEKRDDFVKLQDSLLALEFVDEVSTEDNKRSDLKLLEDLSKILDEYQEQSYLLDPILEDLVTPVADKLRSHARLIVTNPEATYNIHRLEVVALLLYHYVKFRGYKSIVRFFPHEVADLSIALDFAKYLRELKSIPMSIWALRYIALLWLSLICRIPFDLTQFDGSAKKGTTAADIESTAKHYLSAAGLEREGAAVLLSRLYVRQDTNYLLPTFLQWSEASVSAGSDSFDSIGSLHTFCEVVQISPSELIVDHLPRIHDLTKSVAQSSSFTHNAVLRKLRAKLLTRIALRLLPARSTTRKRGRALLVDKHADQETEEEEFDVPEEVEDVLGELFNALQDRDTVVRWSAAKGVARIAERLPTDFANQVLDTVTGLFSIHSLGVASLYDMPAIAEATWNGACLACAEIARRSLVPEDQLSVIVGWMSKALYFDIRKGAHSIGANVRDSAAYVLWSLARAFDASVMQPYANTLSRDLVAVSVFDREVHIRRAASAAFQEHVGRMGIFPHGINVLGKTDFFAVGVRRNSFLVAAPQVAEHEEYRRSLIDHLLNVTARHWDPAMRQVGAQSLRKICELDLDNLAPSCAQRAHKLFQSTDSGDFHGALLILTELAHACRESSLPNHEEQRVKMFKYLNSIPFDVIKSPRNELITAASCHFIASTISLVEIQLDKKSSVPHWREIISVGLKHRSQNVQEAAASALAQSGSPFAQQSLAKLLGLMDYTSFSHSLPSAIDCLLNSVESKSPSRMENVEARRNCYTSMNLVLQTIVSDLPRYIDATTVRRILDALLSGLEDYTIDERGDVGSWIRMACIQSLTRISITILSHAQTIPNFPKYFPAEKYQAAIAGILKQGAERLDNVRQQAGENLLHLLQIPLPDVPDAELWRMPGDKLMTKMFLSDDSEKGAWNDAALLYPKIIRLLAIPAYRKSLLMGLLMSISSKTGSTQRPASHSLVAYAKELPIKSTEDAYGRLNLVIDLLNHARSNLGSNATVIPVLQTFNVLLEADALEDLVDHDDGFKTLSSLLSIASKGIPKLKNVNRISECMKTTVNLATIPKLYNTCVQRLPDFLSHQYPKIRSDTAEYLFLVLQSRDLGKETDEAEETLLETEWSSSDAQIYEAGTKRVVEALLA